LQIESSFDEKVRANFEVRLLAKGAPLSFANFKTHADDDIQSLQVNNAENQSTITKHLCKSK
jgi:hypothetical protein